MAKIYVTEPSTTGGVGASGKNILIGALRRAGHDVHCVEISRREKDLNRQENLFELGQARAIASSNWKARPDAWFISCIYPRQMIGVSGFFSRLGVSPLACDRSESDPLIVFGGQAMISPALFADFADIIALGDGEYTGVEIARLLDQHNGNKGAVLTALAWREGFWVQAAEDAPTITRAEAQIVEPLIPRDLTHFATVEVARGCASKCAFCPIGWAGGTYREADPSLVRTRAEQFRGSTVNFFAPDYSSMSTVSEIEQIIRDTGCRQAGRDARLDSTRRMLQKGGEVREFAFGIEGVSERIREGIGKPLADDKILDVMDSLRGVPKIRWYLIVGFPGEDQRDYAAWWSLIDKLHSVRPGAMDFTFTHLQSVPHTPLDLIDNNYCTQAASFVSDFTRYCKERWLSKHQRWLVSVFKSAGLHTHDCFLQRADRNASAYLLNSKESAITDGKWVDIANDRGVCIADYLAEMPTIDAASWRNVNVGIDRRLVDKARQSFFRRMDRD